MIIYMKHPIHGAKVATMELEAEFDEQHGWVRYNPEKQVLEQPTQVNELQARRRGRQPREAA